MVDAVFLAIILSAVTGMIIGWLTERGMTKGKEYRCPYCKRYHRIMPSRESEYFDDGKAPD